MKLIERITDYLAKGGLFNPELMEHEKVRTLLLECRDVLAERDAIIDCATDGNHCTHWGAGGRCCACGVGHD